MAFAADVPTQLFPGGVPGPGADAGSPLPVHDYDFGVISDYSDLDYDELRATLGLDYGLTPGARLFAGVSYYDLDDSQPYLQDATGSVLLVSGGLTFNF